jgi:ABC-type branched-subunit amino acid transport system ATPase component
MITETQLNVRAVKVRFGDFVALDDINMTVSAREIIGLIGPNGSGKTTLINAMTGFVPLASGAIVFSGRRLHRMKRYAIAACGIARTFQKPRIYATLTPREDCAAAATARQSATLAGMLGMLFKARGEELQRANAVLEEVFAGAAPNSRSTALAHGQRRLLEIARALSTEPRLMLLDEPTSGLSEQESQALLELLKRAACRLGPTIIIVDHRFEFLRRICSRIIVLDAGRKIAEGTPELIANDPTVNEAYFGRLT